MTPVSAGHIDDWQEKWPISTGALPHGRVLVPHNPSARNYGANPYAGYDRSPVPFLFIGRLPEGVEPMMRVVAVDAAAWPLPLLARDGEVVHNKLRISWHPGQRSALDDARIERGRDVGNIRVTRDGKDVAYVVTFAFAFFAFNPDGILHTRKGELRQSHWVFDMRSVMQQNLSIIVPMLNELEELPSLLAHLLPWQRRGCEVLLVDGGSDDGSAALTEFAGFTVITSPAGRARQMNLGAQAAHGDVLLFLHADTRLPEGADALVQEALADGRFEWGRFDVCIEGRSWLLRVVAFFMNLRSRLSGIATGDQAIFVRRAAFEAVGGFPDQPLMEDIELSHRLKRHSPPACIEARAVTSGRRWETRGVCCTIFLMWRLRLAYWRGVAPEQLARAYR
ncbi:MAG: TIGR04283 family arsenosugar biosynthesis glycosyltransferase [Nitrosospira sp.]|nr:TIGR04283 family arsenosugar biosynthesis glycosyltransferase [Nitrosospira sp.]